MCFAIATITRFAKSPSMVPGAIFLQAQLQSCRIKLRAKQGAWIGSIVGFLFVLLSWPVAAQTPFSVVTGLSNPSALALDGNYIYFGENPGSTGHLSRALKTGGPREQLLTGKALHDSGSLVGILGIDFSPTHIYFGYGGYVNTLIEEVPRGGSTTRVLANLSGSSSAGRFSGVLGTNIYYFQNFCNLQRLGTAIGATPVQVASCVWPRSTARDQNSLFFFDLNSRNVYRYDAGTVNSLVPLITGNASEGAVFIDSTNVYFAVGALVRKVSKLGGSVTNIALPAGGVMRQADDAFIYFTVGTQLWRQSSVGSGIAEIISSGISISGDMVSDAGYLYWADTSAGNGAGVINRLQTASLQCQNPPRTLIENNSGAFGLYAGHIRPGSLITTPESPTSAVFNIAGEDIFPGIFPGIRGPLPLWMSITRAPEPGVFVEPNPDDFLGMVMANVNMVRPGGHTSYKISFCDRANARFSLLFDGKAIIFTIATIIVPELQGADLLASIVDFMDDVQKEVPLMASAINKLTIAFLPSTSDATRRMNVASAVRDMQQLALPANLMQRIAYVKILTKYGIEKAFGVSLAQFLSARGFGSLPLAGFVAVVGVKITAAILSVGVVTSATRDLLFNTPIVIGLDARIN